ncbi:Hypothetical Protein FCC1311_002132 [Hondaea fermentalgiana]|uniref:Uncharacterized protein n=1 Tax=Hondaea fermentalgiana TaxID=2315210 RepID=A0A2R5G0E6_9STRA|nr:Hypothetical Protein FCC1311_002132 [Hondaea fermentalgiana]|eukprot:GBG23995.1 Hypothetical Protein FCC1311_002132 [Hondaea fermentalgiana]
MEVDQPTIESVGGLAITFASFKNKTTRGFAANVKALLGAAGAAADCEQVQKEESIVELHVQFYSSEVYKIDTVRKSAKIKPSCGEYLRLLAYGLYWHQDSYKMFECSFKTGFMKEQQKMDVASPSQTLVSDAKDLLEWIVDGTGPVEES